MVLMYVQYGCGITAPDSWVNFDSSPTLRLERLPGYGLIRKRIFPKHVKYGDIVKGLPIDFGTCDGIYSSRFLEHLPVKDMLRALRFTARYLKKDGVFRFVVPDLSQGEIILGLSLFDFRTTISALTEAGFSNVRLVAFNDSEDAMFRLVEDERSFFGCLAMECRR